MGNPDTHYPKRGDKDTAYTAGFKAGMAWREAEIIKLLESDPEEMLYWGGGLRAGYETAIALIKGEK